MASTNKTQYSLLNLWEPEDQVLREDFNSDNLKIDAALNKLVPVKGTYTGTTTSSTPQTITLGFRPSIVIAFALAGAPQANGYIQMALYGANSPDILVTSTGFQVQNGLNASTTERNPYRYIAWQ